MLNISNLFIALPGNIAQGLIWGIAALGVFLTFRVLNIADLTVDGSFAKGGAVAMMLISSGMNLFLVVILSFLAGALAGAVTGVLNTKLRIPEILAGILSQLALFSINLIIMGGKSIQAVNVYTTKLLLSGRYINKSIAITFLIAIILVFLLYWFLGTQIGMSIRATGINPIVSRSQGINVDLNKIIGLSLSNGMVALSGCLFAQYQGSAEINMGRGAIVIGLAAVIIGESLCKVIFGENANFALKMLFIVIGGVVYYIIIGIVLWLRMPTNNLKLFQALVVVIFLSVPNLKKAYSDSFYRLRKNNRGDK